MGLVQLAKRFMGRGPTVPLEEFKKGKPLRNEFVTETESEDGGVILTAPLVLQGSGFMGWVAKRVQAPATKGFELEPVGAFVWSLCDGKHTFDAISRKLRDRFKMNRVEADAALMEFLRMLGQRRLISMSLSKTGGGQKR